jgi:hypothetical protein
MNLRAFLMANMMKFSRSDGVYLPCEA